MKPILQWIWCHRPKHPHTSASAGHLCLTRINLKGNHMSSVTGSYTFPTTRKSGAALSLTDIQFATLNRNGTELQKLAPAAATVNWTDSTPLTGTDTYDAVVVTQDGLAGDDSNQVAVIVAAADPASAGTLTALLQTLA